MVDYMLQAGKTLLASYQRKLAPVVPRGGYAVTEIDEKLLEERLTALKSVRPWTPRLISKLESHIRSASDTELLRINPLRFAADKSLGELETIDLFLHAAALGLFEMN